LSVSIYSRHSPAGVSTILPALKAFVKLPGWRPRFIMMWIFFSSVFLIALLTLMNTMTRYVRKQDPYYIFLDKSKFLCQTFHLTQLQTEHEKDFSITCVPSRDGTYEWGLSFFWIFLTWILLGVWMLGTYSSWMDAQHNCELSRKGRRRIRFVLWQVWQKL
jgi:hypothetical protein